MFAQDDHKFIICLLPLDQQISLTNFITKIPEIGVLNDSIKKYG